MSFDADTVGDSFDDYERCGMVNPLEVGDVVWVMTPNGPTEMEIGLLKSDMFLACPHPKPNISEDINKILNHPYYVFVLSEPCFKTKQDLLNYYKDKDL